MPMHRTTGVLGHLLALLFCLPFLQGQASRTEVAFKLYQGFLTVVRGNIAGAPGILNFVIGTGATRTIVDRGIANHFGPPFMRGQIRHFTAIFPTEWVSIPQIRLGPLHKENLVVAVLDLSQLVSVPIRIDTIVGVDLLRSGSFTLDYHARKMIFGLPRLKHATQMESNLPYLPVQAEVGGHPVWLLVDTGSNELTLYENRLALPLDEHRRHKKKE